MKIITKDKIVVYVLEDSEYVEITDNFTIIGNPETLIVSDCKSDNAKVFENVEAPIDWFGGKYIYDKSKFKLNPDWIEPLPEHTQPNTTGLEQV
jgi:hypothetical protein